MEEIRIAVVDDSPISIMIIREILEDSGFKVVGEATTLEEVRQVVRETKPNVMTMDMVLHDTNGLECTRAVHEIDKNIKIIFVSAMMDDEIVEEAKMNNAFDYIQKPILAEELVGAVRKVAASNESYRVLLDEHVAVFKDALKDAFAKMTKTTLTYEDEYACTTKYEVEGMVVTVGVTGKFFGGMLLSLSAETARNLTVAILKKEPKDKNELKALMAEFANIFSGNACSELNKKNRDLRLRVTPPSVLLGDKMFIAPPAYAATTVIAKTDFGGLLLTVGFKGR